MDLEVLKGCDGVVTGASTFGWWSAYLGQTPAVPAAPRDSRGNRGSGSRVVVPATVVLPGHVLINEFTPADHYHPSWTQIANWRAPK